MAEWTDFQAALFAADRPASAGITRLFLQENARVAYDESGYDLDAFVGNDPGKSAYLEATPGVTYVLFDELYPIPVPLSQAQGGGWRALTLEADLRMEGGGGMTKATFRFFLHRYPWSPTIDATEGVPEGATYVELVANVINWARYSGTLAVPGALTTVPVDGGITSPMAWLWCSSKTDVAGKRAYIRAIRLAEVP